MNKQKLDQRYTQYREYKAQGHTHKEVAEFFGISMATSEKVCKGIAKQKPDYSLLSQSKPNENRAKEIIAKNVFGFTYAGGFTGSDGTADLLCCVCGKVSTQSYISIRKGCNIVCPYCKQYEEEEKKKAIKQQQKQRRIELEQRKHQRQEEKEFLLKQKEHPCIVCGTITTRNKYCCDRCMHKAGNTTKEIRRRHKIQSAMVDTGITVEAIYKRDNGICYLCGGRCDLNDYVNDKGTFIAGNQYPSIDHIIPLAKGGDHSFQNVKLAHRICNSVKAARLVNDIPLV